MRNRDADIARYGLNDVMQFDHVIQVHADGSVTDAPTDTRDSWAPEFNDSTGKPELHGEGWSNFGYGYTSQQGGGAVLHNCESIGAGLERDILAQPGFYVAVYCTWDQPQDDDTPEDEYDGVEGWTVAYRETI